MTPGRCGASRSICLKTLAGGTASPFDGAADALVDSATQAKNTADIAFAGRLAGGISISATSPLMICGSFRKGYPARYTTVGSQPRRRLLQGFPWEGAITSVTRSSRELERTP